MISLFSSFDIFLRISQYLLSLLFFFVFLSRLYHLSSKTIFILSLVKFLEDLFCRLKTKGFTKLYTLTLISIFYLIFFLNFWGVLPFNFPLSSQVRGVLFIPISFCSSIIAFQFLNCYKRILSHLIPERSPIFISFFLFLIEIVRNIIRPLTLTVRLVANIVSGHLLMILLSEIVLEFKPLVSFYIILNLVELFVSLVQAFIFTSLISLYTSEI